MRLCVLALAAWAVSVGSIEASDAPGRNGFTDRRLGSSVKRVRRLPGEITQVYGKELSVGRTYAESSRSFLHAHRAAVDIPHEQFKRAGSVRLMSDKFTLVVYEQEVGGVPVYGKTLKLLIRNGADHPVVLANSLARRVRPSVSGPAIDEAAAVGAARRAEPVAVDFSLPRLCYYTPDLGDARLSWRFFGDTGERSGFDRWEFFVDAVTGELIDQRPGLCHVDIVGTVTGFQTPPPLPDQSNNLPDELPVYGARVWIDGGATVYTDENGDFTLPYAGTGPVTVTADLNGQWATIINDSPGGELSESQEVTPPGPASFLFNPAATPIRTAQANAMTHMTEIHDFVKSLVPDYTGYDFAVPTHVNAEADCTATYTLGSSELYFSRAEFVGCANSAYSSVVFHEYGHLVVDRSPNGPGTPIEYHEGMADVLAAFYTDDPCIAPDLLGMGTGCLRDVEVTETVYPDPRTNPYVQGSILSGAFWDMRTELIATEGPSTGLDIARDLYIGQVFVGTHRVDPTVTVDVLTLDDDDGDITNGTPHRQEICTAFDAHGLTCPELVYLTFDYPQGRPELATPGDETTIRVQVNPHGGQPVAGSGTLSYRIGSSGSFTTVPMTALGGDEYEAVLPAADCGRTIQYYVSADAVGQEDPVRDPPEAPAIVYEAVSVDDLLIDFSDDFETEQGWTVVDGVDLIDGSWERGVPVGGGDLNDPPTDYDGSGQCFVTANRDGNADVDSAGGSAEGTTTLVSPVFDVTDLLEPRVSYARWYANDGGQYGGEDIFEVEVSSNGGTSWVALETVGPESSETFGGWVVKDFRIQDFVALTSQFQIRFTASDVGGASIVEAGIDAFAILESDCCDIDSDCDDGAFCNGSESCVDHVCQPGSDPCDDGVTCTVDTCDEELDLCDWTPDDSACDDGQFCNGAEFCDLVADCQPGVPPSCDDGVSCTDDFCDPGGAGGAGACVSIPNDAHCDDGQFCSGFETCDPVADCQPGVPPSCDDGVSCTDDACDPLLAGGIGACVQTPNDTLCDDGEFCNGAETCDPVADCQVSSDPCAGDPDFPYCDEANDACVECLLDEHCDDSQFCTGPDFCAAGVCESMGDPCTDPTFPVCDEANDLCVWSCAFDEECDDDFVCTVDACNLAIGGCSNRYFAYGNVNRDATINLFDLFCVLAGVSGDMSGCAFAPEEELVRADMDIHPCGGDSVVNLFDVFAVLGAVGGEDPCCGG